MEKSIDKESIDKESINIEPINMRPVNMGPVNVEPINIEKLDYKDNIIREINQALEISPDDAQKIFCFLEENPDIPDAGFATPKQDPGVKNMVAADGLYYINIKLVTLTVIAMVLDVALTKGILSKILGLSKLDSQAIIKISSENGHRCLLKEMLLEKKEGINKSILEKYNGECNNVDHPCNYRVDGECGCFPEDVEKILCELKESKVCRRLENGYYKIVKG